MDWNEITPELKKIIERYLGKHLPEGISATLRNTGYSDRIDFTVNMVDLVQNNLNNINSDRKMTQFVEDLVPLSRKAFRA